MVVFRSGLLWTGRFETEEISVASRCDSDILDVTISFTATRIVMPVSTNVSSITTCRRRYRMGFRGFNQLLDDPLGILGHASGIAKELDDTTNMSDPAHEHGMRWLCRACNDLRNCTEVRRYEVYQPSEAVKLAKPKITMAQ